MAEEATLEKKTEDLWEGLVRLFIKPKPTGVDCIYCGWHGTRAQIFKAKRFNEQGTQYEFDCCPNCLRNGGLEYHD